MLVELEPVFVHVDGSVHGECGPLAVDGEVAARGKDHLRQRRPPELVQLEGELCLAERTPGKITFRSRRRAVRSGRAR